MSKPARKLVVVGIPSDDDLLNIPLSSYSEYSMSEKQARKTRARIYRVNKNNAAYRFRTMYEGNVLRVFRFNKW